MVQRGTTLTAHERTVLGNGASLPNQSGVFALGLLLCTLLMPASVWGGAGDLDPSFGSGGVVTTVIGTGMQLDTHAGAVALQPDGKIVAAGYSTEPRVALARYMPDGSLDTSFGSGGIVTTRMGMLFSGASALALQTDGNIVVVGTALNYQPCGPVGSPLTVSNLFLARYTPDGSLDASFGLSGGTVATVIPCTDVDASDGAVQADGKIVTAGTLSNRSTPSVFVLARYTSDGGIDDSFGSGGMVTTAIGNLNSRATAIVLQPDGQIVVAGYSEGESRYAHFALARYAPDGSLDASFGSGGTVTSAIGSSASHVSGIALQSDGKIVAVGSAYDASSNSGFALARYTHDGSLDPSFGNGGIVTTTIGQYGAGGFAVALQPNAKIVVTGFGYDPAAGHGIAFALARYTPDGSLDVGFGNGGIVTTAVGSLATATAVALQPDGGIVAAGGRFGSWALARYLGYTCTSAPRLCRTAEKSYFLMRNRSDSIKDKLLWKWSKGASTSQAEFADPTTTADYALCVYSGTTSALVGESVIPAGASTWSVLGTTGYRYTDHTAAAGGIAKLVLKGSAQNTASVRVRGKGAALPVLPRPLTAPVTVQLVNGDNELCWGAAFSDSQLLTNDAGTLQARAP
jgi:uncharacterized delta-60 repeat protein